MASFTGTTAFVRPLQLQAEHIPMNANAIQAHVETWDDDQRHQFWDIVAFRVTDELMDPDDAIVATFAAQAYAEIYL